MTADCTRRQVLELSLFGGLAFLPMVGCKKPVATGGPEAGTSAETPKEVPMPTTEYTLPPLPYPYEALEPVIDAETMHLHHDLHHKAYVDGANEAMKMLQSARDNGDMKMVQHWERKLAFNGSGHFLHSLFWQNMISPGKGGEPSKALVQAMDAGLGSLDKMKAQFTAVAKSVEANGWGMLAWSIPDQRLVILGVENHQKQALWAVVPILVCDVWEHAYYLKYHNKRADYVQAWWGIVNWNDVSARFAKALPLALQK
jgi:Fe-Mn family superoxide dismutase